MEKWERLNPGEAVDVPADMTRLTLDTIALCGFGYRFNSFYRETPHPFVEAMVRILLEGQARMRQLPVRTRLRVHAQRQLDDDLAFMNGLVDRLVAERRAVLDDRGEDAADTTDLLGRMITSVDRRTGERLPDDNIRDPHHLPRRRATTSGLLSFATYYLIKNPDVLARARAEVDDVLGSTAAPTFEQVQRLTYVRQVLDESLRLWSTAPAFTRQPYADTVIGGRYALPARTTVTVLIQALHRATSVWGPDAADFNPEHTAPARMAALPANAYKPFGTGQRACIGRQFALQEARVRPTRGPGSRACGRPTGSSRTSGAGERERTGRTTPAPRSVTLTPRSRGALWPGRPGRLRAAGRTSPGRCPASTRRRRRAPARAAHGRRRRRRGPAGRQAAARRGRRLTGGVAAARFGANAALGASTAPDAAFAPSGRPPSRRRRGCGRSRRRPVRRRTGGCRAGGRSPP
jgi:cytochrome P450